MTDDPMTLAIERGLAKVCNGAPLSRVLQETFSAGRDAERIDNLRMEMAQRNAKALRPRAGRSGRTRG